MRSLLFLTAVTALVAPGYATEEVLLDRCDDATAWSVDPGWEFPGAKGAIAITDDGAGGKCLRLDYDFSGGGNYVTAACGLSGFRTASAVVFSVRQEGSNRGFVRLRDATQQEHAGGYTAGPEWTRVVLPLDREHFGGFWHGRNDGQFYFPLNRVLIGVSRGDTPKGALFVKDLAVLTDDAASFCQVTVATSDPGNVVFCGAQDATVRLTVTNRLARAARLGVRGTLRGWHGESREFAFDEKEVTGHGSVTHVLRLGARRPGYYVLEAEVRQGGQPVGTTQGAVVVTPRPANFGVDDPQSFFGAQHTTDGARLERLGCKWVRAGRDWWYGELVEDHYQIPDLTGLRRNHQLVMFTMTASPPQWALARAPEATFWEAPGYEERVGWWSDYVTETVRELAVHVDTFEIQNEPDLTCMYQVGLDFAAGVQRYVRILEAGSRAIRAAAPGTKVAGIDVSGGDYDQGLPYSRAVMAAAGGAIDIYTGHPYAGVRYFGPGQNPLWPVANDERRKCQDTLKMIRDFGGGKRFWIGEKGWGLDVRADPLSEHSRDFARCLVQSMVLAHSVPGVERYFWFLEEGCNEHGYEYGLFRGGIPLPAALAYATLAQVLHHATPYRSPDLGPLVQAHCFTSAETRHGTLVLWAEGQPASVALARLPADVERVEMMGRTVSRARAGESLTVHLEREPVYLRFPAARASAMCRALADATVSNEQPLILEAAYAADLTHLGARVRNVTAAACAGELIYPDGRITVQVPAMETRAVLLPLKKELSGRQGEALTVALHVRNSVQRAVVRLNLAPLATVGPEAPRIAGTPLPDFRWWEERPAMVLDSRRQVYPPDPMVGWSGPEDLSVRAWVGWDESFLHLAAVVRDPVHFVASDSPADFWQSDSLQLALDPLNDAGEMPGFLEDDREVGLVLGPSGGRAVQTVPEPRGLDVPCRIVREGEETRYQVAVPWELVGVPPSCGRVLGLNFLVNQNNGQGRAYWMGLTPGIGEAKRPAAYQDFYLAP